MFKTTVHIVIAMFLLLATAGVTISMHYCGGSLVYTSINQQAESCCDDDGCCENKTLHYELEDDYLSPIVVDNNNLIEMEILFPILFVMNFDLSAAQAKPSFAFIDSYPPPKIQTRLSLLQVYLI
ncbi:hypothetical protein SAMN06265379_101292 [Saccharicrinis carchari]|uniref:Uncharacterized protein n=1 Tax=Saccharicrinis carchari TaxID=1168039 RepID=A0A521APR9_SACCC|nr:hypothetical protein [Saccharicrinis carchari]SMO36630.1 hypothetical protein SAMN06265379_101292 [Saccharicrinis carchari]